MLELNVQDLRLRGRGFTLFKAAEENKVKEDLMDFLVGAIYQKLGLCSGDFDEEEKIKEKNPAIPDTILVEDLSESAYSDKYSVKDLLDSNLVTQDGNVLKLTEKSVAILNRAAALQRELENEGFHCCPCHF